MSIGGEDDAKHPAQNPSNIRVQNREPFIEGKTHENPCDIASNPREFQ